MKTYTEIKTYFNNLTKDELLQYHNEISTIQNPDDYVIVKEIVKYCFEQIDVIYVQINKLHWYLANALINKLNEQ